MFRVNSFHRFGASHHDYNQTSPRLSVAGLHKGDFLTVRDESPNEYVIEITTAVHPTGSQMDIRRAALARFATGTTVAQPSSTQELDDARCQDLRAKHVK